LRFAIAAAATTTGLGLALGDVRRFDEAIQARQWDIAICEEPGTSSGADVAVAAGRAGALGWPPQVPRRSSTG
jgi:hypothetical protein